MCESRVRRTVDLSGWITKFLGDVKADPTAHGRGFARHQAFKRRPLFLKYHTLNGTAPVRVRAIMLSCSENFARLSRSRFAIEDRDTRWLSRQRLLLFSPRRDVILLDAGESSRGRRETT